MQLRGRHHGCRLATPPRCDAAQTRSWTAGTVARSKAAWRTTASVPARTTRHGRCAAPDRHARRLRCRCRGHRATRIRYSWPDDSPAPPAARTSASAARPASSVRRPRPRRRTATTRPSRGTTRTWIGAYRCPPGLVGDLSGARVWARSAPLPAASRSRATWTWPRAGFRSRRAMHRRGPHGGATVVEGRV